ncbi:fasciclin domain-containing protein [Lentiprolixibacter aurantiacus]|uniref:Fasciclin domain-containing protein n=1 Tax=Lentiprolixibacter aurantiacus TaxID=2993939 RepID=A0AAE3MLB7_9FLAO|nr:fasciclin domain-containing protein [Lentiprolixibacter aurantiacus]MCX2719421.1 fasciclin domain-containing protein [Lentiprolixibacter aurantiacus]
MKSLHQFTLVVCLLIVGYVHAQISADPFSTAALKPSILESEVLVQNHKTLLQALKMTDLDKMLGSRGPITIFAPSDTAFRKLLGRAQSEWLTPENKQELLKMLTYHMVVGELTASRMLQAMASGKGSAVFKTIQGNEILATLEGTDILLTDCSGNTAKIKTEETNLSNGVVHVIDSVISPGTPD